MANCLLLLTAQIMTAGDLNANSIIASSIMGRKLTLRNFSVTEQDAIVCYVRINAFHANIDVIDNKQMFWF
jgi:hypothetical protein